MWTLVNVCRVTSEILAKPISLINNGTHPIELIMNGLKLRQQFIRHKMYSEMDATFFFAYIWRIQNLTGMKSLS